MSMIFCGCNESKEENTLLVSPETETSYSTLLYTYKPQTLEIDIRELEEIEKKMRNRDVWNIELSIKQIDADFIILEIRDFDKLGFWVVDGYFVLERWENEKWVKLTDMDESMLKYGERSSFISTNKEQDYVTFDIYNPCRNIKLFPAHYRITQHLNGNPFSLEFDIK